MWKNIEGFDSYEVYSNGSVKNIITGKMLAQKNNKGYYRVTLRKNNKYHHKYIHRLVGQAFLENLDNLPQIDHIDGNKSNNYVENLRWCTIQQNRQNQKITSRNTSGIKGVSWQKSNQKWMCQITIKNKHYYLGYYDCKEEGGLIYEFFALAFHKEFANITRKYNAWYSPQIYQKIKELLEYHQLKL